MSPQKIYNLADRALAYSFYLLFFLVPLAFTSWNFELFEYNKMMLTYALTVVIAASWALKALTGLNPVIKRTPLDVFLLVFLASQILSTLFSIDRHTSIWGYYTRSHGGLLSTISYLVLYWAFVSNMDAKRTLSSVFYLLSSATVAAVWGILEHFGVSPSCLLIQGELGVNCWVQDVQLRVFATLGQPNWMAAWLVALMPVSWALAVRAKNEELKTKSYLWMGLSAPLFLALLYTKSRSGLLGFAVASAVFWSALSWINRNRLKRIIRPALILNTSYLILILLFGTPWAPTLGQLAQPPTTPHTSPATETGTVLERGGTESGEIRKVVWQGAIDIWRTYPLLGTGVETFAYSYYQFRPAEHNRTSEWEFLYNKAHNEYLNFASTTGIVGLGTYLLLIGAVAWFFTKSIKDYLISNKSEKLIPNTYYLIPALASGYVSILVTNFFGFSVVPVATLFFLYPAMGATLIARSKEEVVSIKENKKLNTHSLILINSIIIITSYLILSLARLWYADVLFARGDKLNRAGQPAQAIVPLQRAARINPEEPNYYDKLSVSFSQIAAALAEQGETGEAEGFAVAAQNASDRAVKISPKNVNFWKNRALVFIRLTGLDPGYLNLALQALAEAQELSPTDPKITYNLALTYYRLGDEEAAEELLKEAIGLKQDYYDPRIALAELYIQQKKNEPAREQLQYILENLNPEDKLAREKLEELE